MATKKITLLQLTALVKKELDKINPLIHFYIEQRATVNHESFDKHEVFLDLIFGFYNTLYDGKPFIEYALLHKNYKGNSNPSTEELLTRVKNSVLVVKANIQTPPLELVL